MNTSVKIEDRSYEFALRIIHLVQALPTDFASQVIVRQVLRSGTSVGANVEEAIGAASKKDFANNPVQDCLDHPQKPGGRIGLTMHYELCTKNYPVLYLGQPNHPSKEARFEEASAYHHRR